MKILDKSRVTGRVPHAKMGTAGKDDCGGIGMLARVHAPSVHVSPSPVANSIGISHVGLYATAT